MKAKMAKNGIEVNIKMETHEYHALRVVLEQWYYEHLDKQEGWKAIAKDAINSFSAIRENIR